MGLYNSGSSSNSHKSEGATFICATMSVQRRTKGSGYPPKNKCGLMQSNFIIKDKIMFNTS